MVAHVADGEDCRIYLFPGGEAKSGKWFWVANRNVYLGSGYADSPREAALEAERRSFA